MKPLAVAFALILTFVVAHPARAQISVERFSRQLEQIQRDTTLKADTSVPVGQRTLVDYGGYLSLNYFLVEDFNRNTHVLRQYDLVGYGRVNIDGVHEFFGRGFLQYQDFNPGDSFDGEGDDFHPTFDRLYYRFDLQRYIAAYEGRLVNYNLTFQGGRQLVYWGNGLTLSQVLDGAVVDLSWGPLTLELIGGVTPQKDTVDFDSSRPHFDDDTFRGFYGGIFSWQVTPKHRPYVYALFQQDYNNSYTRDTGVIQTRFDYYSWYIGAGATGSIGDRFLYAVEFVYEGGSGLSNSFTTAGGLVQPIPQTDDDISAWAADVRLDYLFADDRRTRLSGEVIAASGDDDRLHSSNTFGGNTPGTDDQAFNAFGLLNTGLAFAPNVSNLLAFRVGASTFPAPDNRLFRRLQVGADVFIFNKMDADAPIDEPTLDGRYLGWEPDVFINWQITSDVTLALRYGIFFPSSDTVISDDSRQFFFAGLTFAF
jgi:hypothetical protein